MISLPVKQTFEKDAMCRVVRLFEQDKHNPYAASLALVQRKSSNKINARLVIFFIIF